MWGGLLDVKPI